MHLGSKFKFHFYPDWKQPTIYLFPGRISNLIYDCCFWFSVWVFSGLNLICFMIFCCPPPFFVIFIALIDNCFYLSISVHVSQSFPANLPKVPLLPPQLSPKENNEPGMGVLDILGLFALVAGSLAVFILACCCYCRCFKSPATNL